MKYHLSILTQENFKRPFIDYKQNNIVKPKLIFMVTKETIDELSWIFKRDEFPIIQACFSCKKVYMFRLKITKVIYFRKQIYYF